MTLPGTLADPQSQHRAGADEPPTRAEDGWPDQSVTALLQHWAEGPAGGRLSVAPLERAQGGSVAAGEAEFSISLDTET